ncbi:hypothetical protein SAMN02910356_02144 [Selenomonas sp. GACV-9]|uniref:hypothetical protein n=1 Tax=Selenomonas sp. GACV-9 TaxID=3158782 RepID=UPI0008E4FE11|nr:hypothetical protein SAMN02910356_02144 [Selenomonas ruminantium]
MMEEKLTQELQSFDFSACHPVKERLLGKLLQMHRQDNAKGKSKWAAAKMSEEALDWVAAAGTPTNQERQEQRKDE